MMKKTDALYPPIEPYETGELLVGDGHRVYWEVSVTPRANPWCSCTAVRERTAA